LIKRTFVFVCQSVVVGFRAPHRSDDPRANKRTDRTTGQLTGWADGGRTGTPGPIPPFRLVYHPNSPPDVSRCVALNGKLSRTHTIQTPIQAHTHSHPSSHRSDYPPTSTYTHFSSIFLVQESLA